MKETQGIPLVCIQYTSEEFIETISLSHFIDALQTALDNWDENLLKGPFITRTKYWIPREKYKVTYKSTHIQPQILNKRYLNLSYRTNACCTRILLKAKLNTYVNEKLLFT